RGETGVSAPEAAGRQRGSTGSLRGGCAAASSRGARWPHCVGERRGVSPTCWGELVIAYFAAVLRRGGHVGLTPQRSPGRNCEWTVRTAACCGEQAAEAPPARLHLAERDGYYASAAAPAGKGGRRQPGKGLGGGVSWSDARFWNCHALFA